MVPCIFRSQMASCVVRAGLTFEFTRERKRANPAVGRRVQRRVGRHPSTMSRPGVLHERGNLHELDASSPLK
jgi:hypothetical protein